MRAIITKYHGATTYKGSRISATVYMTANKKMRVYVPYQDSSTECPHVRALHKLCYKLKWIVREWTEGELSPDSMVWVNDRGRKVAI